MGVLVMLSAAAGTGHGAPPSGHRVYQPALGVGHDQEPTPGPATPTPSATETVAPTPISTATTASRAAPGGSGVLEWIPLRYSTLAAAGGGGASGAIQIVWTVRR
jgi:hypothetical protein